MEVIVPVNGFAALLHFLKELGRIKKMEAESMSHFCSIGLFKTSYVFVRDDRQEREGESAISVIKKKQNQKRRAIVQSGFELQYIFNYKSFFLVF